MPRKKRQPGPGEEGYTEIVSEASFFGSILDAPTLEPSFSRGQMLVYLYLCPACGWWDISTGVDEVFGSFVHHAGPRTEPCERCQHTPMYLVKRTDLLHRVIDSESKE